jgi:hypothetical protein
MVFGAGQCNDHGSKGGDPESRVDHEVREEDEPPISVSSLELAGAFSASYRSSWILATDT